MNQKRLFSIFSLGFAGLYLLIFALAFTACKNDTADPAPSPPAENKQTPVAGDYDISGLTHTYDGSPKSVTITPKAGKSSGAVTVYYNGSPDAPSAAGSYTVSFNVAAAAGWNAAAGLQAGTLAINPGIPGNQTPIADDYTVSGLEHAYDGSPKSVTITPKEGKSSGARTVRYNNSSAIPSAVGSYTVSFDVAEAPGWNAASGLQAGTLVIHGSASDKVKYKIYSDGTLSDGYTITNWANADAFQLATMSGGGHSGTQAMRLPDTGESWGRGLSIRASSASAIDWSTVGALSFWVKGDNVRINAFGFLDDAGSGADPLNVEYKGENEQGLTLTNTWQNILIPLPNNSAKGTAISRIEVFKIYITSAADQDNKAVYIDDIELISATKDFAITIPSSANISAGTVSISSLLGNYKAAYTVDGKTVSLFNNTVRFANWFDTAYNVGGSASRNGDNISATGNFTLSVSFGGKTSNTLSVTVTQAPAVVPSGWIGADDALSVDSNGYLRNRKNQEVILRGVNLGGWMLQETWMCAITGSAANLETIRAMEGRGWTAAQIQELFDTYQDNLIRVEDFDLLKARGVNSIRLPFWYRNFMADEYGTWINSDNGSSANTRNPGFKRLDWAITQAKKRGMYIILDMHGLPGGQSMDHCCGTLDKNEVYTNPAYEQAAADLWRAIAARYKDEATVAAYDLMNEPQNNGGHSGPNAWAPDSTRAVHETVRLYDRLYREVRSVDQNTIVMMEGIWSMNLPDPKYVHNGGLDQSSRYSGKTVVWNNVMYSMHLYDKDQGGITNRVNELKNARNNWKVAVHIGEFNNDENGNQPFAYDLYNTNKINWNMWTYKIAGANVGNWSLYQASGKTNVNPYNDSISTIKQRWGETLRTFNPGTTNTANGYSQTGMNSYFNTGLGHTVAGVFTNSNQSGFPAGGINGPIFVEDNDTGSGLLGETYAAYGSVNLEGGWMRYEAENTAVASIHNSTRTTDTPPGSEPGDFYSGGKAAGGINKTGNISAISPTLDWSTTSSIAYVKFTVNVTGAGSYLIKIRYNGNEDKSILVKANTGSHKILSLPEQAGGAWNTVYARQLDLQLNNGQNTIWVSGTIGDGWANIDCIDIRNTPL